MRRQQQEQGEEQEHVGAGAEGAGEARDRPVPRRGPERPHQRHGERGVDQRGGRGGSPEEKHDVYVRSSPITYVDAVAAPVLVVAGANDPRCPIRQIENYLGELDRLGKRHEVYRFDAGHGSLVIEETIRQVEVALSFALRRVPPS